jgi:hypothetical protein
LDKKTMMKRADSLFVQNFYKFTLIFMLVCLLSTHVPQAYASPNNKAEQKTETSIYFNPPKLNRDIKLTRTEFDKQTVLIKEIPFGDQSLSYSLRLPSSWKKVQNNSFDQYDPAKTKDVLGTITEYVSPINIDQRSRFRVRAAQLPFAISAKDWLLNYVVKNNYTLQGIEAVNDRRIAAQFVYVDNGTQFVSRAVLQISGANIVLAEMIVPVNIWATERDSAVWSMISYRLTSPSRESAEPILSHSFVDIAKFSYPKSWLLYASPITSIERMSATLINIRGGSENRKVESLTELSQLDLDGRIDITSVVKKDKTTLATEMSLLRQSLKGLQFTIGDYVEQMKFDGFNKSVLQSRTDVYKLSSPVSKIIDYELWISVVETGGRYYIVQTISIGRYNDFYVWARNKEALKLVLQSLQPAKG